MINIFIFLKQTDFMPNIWSLKPDPDILYNMKEFLQSLGLYRLTSWQIDWPLSVKSWELPTKRCTLQIHIIHQPNTSLYTACLPPVTSHIGVIGESSGGTPPRGSGSTEALPGMRNTRANRRWSQRKGSLVSSLPGSGVVSGRWSWMARNRRISVSMTKRNNGRHKMFEEQYDDIRIWKRWQKLINRDSVTLFLPS